MSIYPRGEDAAETIDPPVKLDGAHFDYTIEERRDGVSEREYKAVIKMYRRILIALRDYIENNGPIVLAYSC